MALIPHKADPNYAELMKEHEKYPDRWGAGAFQSPFAGDLPVYRVARRLSYHYGLAPSVLRSLNTIAQQLLDEAKGDESKVNLESVRAVIRDAGMMP